MSGAFRSAPQRGFALLALLFVGMAGAGSWLVISQPRPDANRAEAALEARERERRAAEALMAHATLYADLYGPTGAGPGHLACPDRDRTPGVPDGPARLPLAGPDPPCATRPEALGALPLHISIGRLRAGIDSASVADAALAYRVQAAVVNNPLNRVVNGRTLPTILASVGAPGAGTPLSLRRSVTGPAIRRRVAAWLIGQLAHRSVMVGCAVAAECSPPMPGSGPEGAPDTASGIGPGEAALIDGVPAARHWFVRNGWAEDFLVRVDAMCRHDLAACAVRIDPGTPMRIRFQPRGVPRHVPAPFRSDVPE